MPNEGRYGFAGDDRSRRVAKLRLEVADHLPALGHEVAIFTAAVGITAEFAREQGLRVVTAPADLPPEADATIAFDRVLAVDMAAHYPRARRLFGMHNTDEFWLPPTEPGIVAATLALLWQFRRDGTR
ncbi:hypothetical protein [Azospirillum picis]|uniref:Uncharacterized protein n=1 Tax=Azospirillum picis TaxID=488438 RepID=A0ABU0MU68_9PROT|nr:hypothetical protein [Azospirillum picis]MBP2300939.1 hypothetical protein [Azospirillum picis]MDQ0537043.1 hypothetical protein [Azospirillum picis]